MIPFLEPVTVNSAVFLFLGASLLLIVRSRHRAHFELALATSGVIMAISWLSAADFVALLSFLLVPYIAVRYLRQTSVSGSILASGVVALQILLFLIFKRYAWFDVLGVFDHPVSVIGISYIMFRQISLIVEATRMRDLAFGPVQYVGYLLSPFTLLAGPIQRYDLYVQGIENLALPDPDTFRKNAHRIANGLLKAFVFAPLFLEPSRITLLANPQANWLEFLIVFYSYPIYLYLNFSGYIDVIMGLARLCGFSTLPENFDRPYLAKNVRDFWARWHISFGMWVRSYLFIPLSTALTRRSPAALVNVSMSIAVMITFYLVGVWHGTTANFVVFGLVQGAGVVASAWFNGLMRKFLGKARHREYQNNKVIHMLSVILTFHFTCASFLLLENSIDDIARSLEAFIA